MGLSSLSPEKGHLLARCARYIAICAFIEGNPKQSVYMHICRETNGTICAPDLLLWKIDRSTANMHLVWCLVLLSLH